MIQLFQRLAHDVPKEFNVTPTSILKSVKFCKIPGLVALPNNSKAICPGALVENVLFKEDFSSAQTLFKAIAKCIIQPRQTDPVSWEPAVQNFFIAGLFSMTYSSFVFPLRTLKEATEALYHLTEQQADIQNQQVIARRTVTGPPGTGKYIGHNVYQHAIQEKRG